MATLWVNSGYQLDFSRKISAYVSKISAAQNVYTSTQARIQDHLDDGNISIGNVYLQKRNEALSGAAELANSIETKTTQYVERVISADLEVSNSIHKQSYAFYKEKKIGPQKDVWYARAWNSVTTTARDFVHDADEVTERMLQDIHDFYDKHKYLFEVAKDILAVSAALGLFVVAAGASAFFAPIILIGATWALSKALYDTGADLLACDAWSRGDIARAEELSNRSLAGEIISGGEWLDQKLGIHMFKTAFKAVTIGFEVCEMVAISMGVLEAVKATFGLSELESLKFQNSGHISFKQSIYYARGVPKRMINAFLADPGGVLKATVGHLGKYNTIGSTLGDGIARIILA